MLSFDKIVNRLLSKSWKVFFKEDIFDIIDPEKKDKYKSYLNKVIYRLKSEELIISIKAGVYVVPSNEDSMLNKVDLLDKYYMSLLKKYIIYYVWSSYYISWNKSLEFHNKDFSIPEKIFIVTRDLNKKLKVWDYEIIFKTISWKTIKSNNKKINLYSKLEQFVVKKEIEWNEFKISCLELSLLESSLISDTLSWLDFNLLNKTIKKYSWVLRTEIFYELWEYKFIMSFNRLKEISKNINKDLYLVFLDIIKKNGWMFIWEWVRGF